MKNHTGTLGGSPAGRRLDKLLCALAAANPRHEKILSHVYKVIARWQRRVQYVMNGVTDKHLASEIIAIFKQDALHQVEEMMLWNDYLMIDVSPRDQGLINSLTRNVITFIGSSAIRSRYGQESLGCSSGK
jgi:hypothetical protein